MLGRRTAFPAAAAPRGGTMGAAKRSAQTDLGMSRPVKRLRTSPGAAAPLVDDEDEEIMLEADELRAHAQPARRAAPRRALLDRSAAARGAPHAGSAAAGACDDMDIEHAPVAPVTPVTRAQTSASRRRRASSPGECDAGSDESGDAEEDEDEDEECAPDTLLEDDEDPDLVDVALPEEASAPPKRMRLSRAAINAARAAAAADPQPWLRDGPRRKATLTEPVPRSAPTLLTGAAPSSIQTIRRYVKELWGAQHVTACACQAPVAARLRALTSAALARAGAELIELSQPEFEAVVATSHWADFARVKRAYRIVFPNQPARDAAVRPYDNLGAANLKAALILTKLSGLALTDAARAVRAAAQPRARYSLQQQARAHSSRARGRATRRGGQGVLVSQLSRAGGA